MSAWRESSCHICLPRVLLCFLCTHLLHNFIQENIEIIYFGWCVIKITNGFLGYIFSSCKHLLVFFEDLEFHKIFFAMNWKKYVLILEVVLRNSRSLDFFQLVQILFNSSIHGFSLAQIIVQDTLLQSLLKVTNPSKYVFNAFTLKRKNQIPFDWLIFFIPFYTT